jgi:hypothetical protein
MNLLSIIEEIEKVDPEFKDRVNPRRAAIRNITSFGSKVAIAAIPFAFTTLFKKAYGQLPFIIWGRLPLWVLQPAKGHTLQQYRAMKMRMLPF